MVPDLVRGFGAVVEGFLRGGELDDAVASGRVVADIDGWVTELHANSKHARFNPPLVTSNRNTLQIVGHDYLRPPDNLTFLQLLEDCIYNILRRTLSSQIGCKRISPPQYTVHRF